MQTDAAPFVSEYLQRLKLAKLGYQTDFYDLSDFKAEIFCLIDDEIDKLKSEDRKKKPRKA